MERGGSTEGSGGGALGLDDHVGDEVRGLAGVGEGAGGLAGARREAPVLLEAAPDLHGGLRQHQPVASERPPRRPQHRPVRRQALRRRRRRHFPEVKKCVCVLCRLKKRKKNRLKRFSRQRNLASRSRKKRI
ncbi:hypothetical protein EE612_028989 [Oryza sativa]|nr:hypothetical protein EE612_028989 [Oryza sativa]